MNNWIAFDCLLSPGNFIRDATGEVSFQAGRLIAQYNNNMCYNSINFNFLQFN